MPRKSEEKVLLVKDAKGEFRVTLPAGAKLTFGPNVPYARKGGYGQEAGYALRVYQGSKENLIAVFANVEWFRDVSLDVSRLIVREAGKTVWKSDEKGYKVEESVQRQETWAKQLTAEAGPVREDMTEE